jgi:hypothetical protein
MLSLDLVPNYGFLEPLKAFDERVLDNTSQ